MSLEKENKFNSNISPLFIIPHLKLQVLDWKDKKKKLLDLMDKCVLSASPLLKTTFSNEVGDQNKLIGDIFQEELDYMKQSFGFNDYQIKQSWFQEQKRNMFHPMHDHFGPSMMMSSVCYIDYNSSEHTATQFISPFLDSLSYSYLYFTPEVSEGTIIFFPSNVLHQSLPNISDKSRKIVSFNLELK